MRQSNDKNKKIDLQETVSLLCVSSATVRNWVKSNYIAPYRNNKNELFFDYAQIRNLKEKIISGEINRLNKRANKKHSTSVFIPEEYADNQDAITSVKKIVSLYKTKQLKIESILLAIAINILHQNKLLNHQNCLDSNLLNFKNKTIKQEVLWWYENINSDSLADKYYTLLTLRLPKANDFLGLTYQSLIVEGSKSKNGSYYTPKKIVDDIIADYISPQSIILDPCCGTGQFLLSAAERVNNPENLWGFDVNEIAVRLARLNLLIKFNKENFSPNIYTKNTLLEINTNTLFSGSYMPKFDIVITNPPWGAHFKKTETAELKQLYPEIQSNEAFSYFLYKGLQSLKNEGILSFILPESILNVKAHKDIRSIILKKSRINKIKYLGRVFKNVFTPVIRIDITNKKPVDGHQFISEKKDLKYTIKQKRLKKNIDYIFDVFINDKDMKIFKKVYDIKHTTLKNNAEWALGVVSGNNKEFLSSKKTKENELIITGKNIRRYITNKIDNFIVFESKKFQQVAPENKYRAKEKLIYKFISKELVFCYDNKRKLTLNSANIVIPNFENYPMKTILALFNSTLYQFLYQKKFGALKILKSDLETLPLPIITTNIHKRIDNFVSKLLNKKIYGETRKRENIYSELDDYIMDIFSLTNGEKSSIRNNVKMSKKLLNII